MKKFILLAFLAALPFSAQAQAQAQVYDGCEYYATIKPGDKFNSSGMDLRKLKGRAAVAAILRQNRANEAETYGFEGTDACMAKKSDRAFFEQMVLNSHISQSAANAIIYGTPHVRVQLSVGPRGQDVLEVEVLKVAPKSKSYSGVVY